MRTLKIILLVALLVSRLPAQFLYDTLKYVKFYDKPIWSLYQNYYANSFGITQNYAKDSITNTALNINAESFKEIGIAYAKNQYYFTINLFGILNEAANRKPRPKYANGTASFSDRDYLWEGGFNWFSGYYDKNSSNLIRNFNDSVPFYNYGKLRSLNTFINYVHFTNPKSFSYNAAYKGTARQKRSAGSLAFFTTVNYNRLESDSAIIPYTVRNAYREQGQMSKLFNTHLVGGIGYSGTLVLFKSLFINATLMVGPGLQLQQYALKTQAGFKNRAGLLFYGDGRFAFGLNLKRLVIYSTTHIQFRYYTIKQLQVNQTFLSNTFSIGYRFNQRYNKYKP